MSSIPSSAMPHARVHEDENEPSRQTELMSKAKTTGRKAANFAAGSIAIPVTAALVAATLLSRWLGRAKPTSLQPA
jgi:hypothetical protein